MVFKVKERYSLHREYADCLLLYDLSSSVGRDPFKVDDISFTVEAIENAFRGDVLIYYSDLYKLKYDIGVDIDPLKEKMKSVIQSEYKIRSNNEVKSCVDEFRKLYHERHLQYKDHTALTITNYLSLCEMLKCNYRLNVFHFALEILFEANVNDYSVCRKLFLFVEDLATRRFLFSTLEPHLLRYLLQNLCKQDESHEYIWNDVDMAQITACGCFDLLKVTLDYKGCVEFYPEELDLSFEIFFNTVPCDDIFPKEYSAERLILLLQMANMMQNDPKDFDDSRETAIEALKLSWKTIPQAYFTWEEMKDVLEKLIINIYKILPSDFFRLGRAENESKIQRAIEEYKRTFDVPVKKPRSLKNYARIAVRKRCRTADAIDELVPCKRLRAYVKLQ